MDTNKTEREVIPGYEGLYCINRAGLVYRVDTGLPVAIQIEKRRAPSRGGYCFVTLWKDGNRKNHKVHRLVMQVFIGEIPEGYEVNHIDSDRLNNCLSNLEYVTRSENIQHAMESTGSYRGEKHSQSKLTEETVRQIRASTLTNTELAKQFNVSRRTINYVRTKGWTHVR